MSSPRKKKNISIAFDSPKKNGVEICLKHPYMFFWSNICEPQGIHLEILSIMDPWDWYIYRSMDGWILWSISSYKYTSPIDPMGYGIRNMFRNGIAARTQGLPEMYAKKWMVCKRMQKACHLLLLNMAIWATKKTFYFPLYWLVYRDPYIGLWKSP